MIEYSEMLRMEVRIVKMLCFIVLAFAFDGVAWRASRVVAATSHMDETPIEIEPSRIEVDADRLDYNRATGWVEARGHVVIQKGDQELRADHVRLNRNTEDFYASGNVRLKRAGEVWEGENLRGNLRTETWKIDTLTGNSDPFRVIEVEEAEKGRNGTFILHRPVVTTCTNAFQNCHFHVRAREIEVVSGEYMKARGAVWYFGAVPVMYMPYWYRNLKEDFGFRFYPGYDSRMGAFLLSSYYYRVNPVLKGETHLDYRTKRGIAVGQDFKWRQPQGRWLGDLSMYYADDKKPIDDDEDAETSDIDSDRYRVRLKHHYNMSDRDYMLTQLHYLSDTDILEDFFESEYRAENQPENYLSYSHRGDKYMANILLRARLNDFYSHINRLPEMSLDFMRQQIGDSSFYYDGQTAAVNLEQVWEKNRSDRNEYSVFRVDSSHLIHRPARHFGFLNLTPRVGFRETYYSDTREIQTSLATNLVSFTNLVVDASGNTNSVVSLAAQTNTISNEIQLGADNRSYFELGFETSFKAFKVWGDEDSLRRHIVEPYANYTFVPEPSLLADRLYQFDEVDKLGEQNSVRVGVRNKLQAKRDDRPFDLVDIDISTTYNIDHAEGEHAIDTIAIDAELWPAEWFYLDFDAVFSVEESELERFNSRAEISQEELWSVYVEYRFRNESSSLVLADLTWFPSQKWTLNTYGRYEFETGRMEEQGGYVQRNFDCMVVRTGVTSIPGFTRSDGSEREDEVRFMVQFWLTAFPEASLGAGKIRK